MTRPFALLALATACVTPAAACDKCHRSCGYPSHKCHACPSGSVEHHHHYEGGYAASKKKLFALEPAPAAGVVGSVPMVVAAPMAMASVGFAPTQQVASRSLTDELLAARMLMGVMDGRGDAAGARGVSGARATGGSDLADRIERIENEIEELADSTVRLARVVERLEKKCDEACGDE